MLWLQDAQQLRHPFLPTVSSPNPRWQLAREKDSGLGFSIGSQLILSAEVLAAVSHVCPSLPGPGEGVVPEPEDKVQATKAGGGGT